MLLPLGADLVLTPNLGDTGDGLQHPYLNRHRFDPVATHRSSDFLGDIPGVTTPTENSDEPAGVNLSTQSTLRFTP